MEDIIGMIETLKYDKGIKFVDNDIIKQYILDNIDLLIDEIDQEVN
jgi:hypothetical protein